MNLQIRYECKNIDWSCVSIILKTVGMGYYEGEVHKKVFENSHTVVFVLDNDKIIGFGRVFLLFYRTYLDKHVTLEKSLQ